jgi:hypothetical protein
MTGFHKWYILDRRLGGHQSRSGRGSKQKNPNRELIPGRPVSNPVTGYNESKSNQPNVEVKWLTILFSIQEVSGSSLDSETGSLDRGF